MAEPQRKTVPSMATSTLFLFLMDSSKPAHQPGWSLLGNQTNHSGFFHSASIHIRIHFEFSEKVEILVSAIEKEKQGNKFKNMYITYCKYVYQRRQWQPTSVLLPGKSHGWRSLIGTFVRVAIWSKLWLSLIKDHILSWTMMEAREDKDKNISGMNCRKTTCLVHWFGIMSEPWLHSICRTFFSFLMANTRGLWDFSSPTRDWTQAHASESTES